MDCIEIEYKRFCEWIWDYKGNGKTDVNILLEEIREKFHLKERQLQELSLKVRKTFIPQYHRYWKTVCRSRVKFEQKYEKFMQRNFSMQFSSSVSTRSEKTAELLKKSSNVAPLSTSESRGPGRGRPRKDSKHTIVSGRTRKRRCEELRRNYSSAELAAAACVKKKLITLTLFKITVKGY